MKYESDYIIILFIIFLSLMVINLIIICVVSRRRKKVIETEWRKIEIQRETLNDELKKFTAQRETLNGELKKCAVERETLNNERAAFERERGLFEINKLSRDQVISACDEKIRIAKQEISSEWSKILKGKAEIGRERSAVEDTLKIIREERQILSDEKKYILELSSQQAQKEDDYKNTICELSSELDSVRKGRADDQAAYRREKARLFDMLISTSTVYKYIKKSFTCEFIHNAPVNQDRLFNYIDDLKNHEDYCITDLYINAHVRGSKGLVYQTDLNSCSCPDFKFNGHVPCKHMYRLAHELAMFNDMPSDTIDREIKELTRVNRLYRELLDKYVKLSRDDQQQITGKAKKPPIKGGKGQTL